MTQQTIGIGTTADDGTGDNLRAAGAKINQNFTELYGAVATLTDAATIATDASLGPIFKVTLGGNRTLANPTNLVEGRTYIWKILQDGTGSRTLSYGSMFKWASGTAPTLTTTASHWDIITGVYLDSVLSVSISLDRS